LKCELQSIIVGAILLGISLVGCHKPEPLRLPPELLGRWTTTAPKYADRYFELRANHTAVFGLGGRRVDVSPIVAIELVRDGDFLQYHISHLSEVGEVYRFSLSYHPARPSELRFVNQPNIVWTKGRGYFPR